MYANLIRPALFALTRDDPEKAHELMVRAIEGVQHTPFLLQLIELSYESRKHAHPVTIAGIEFPNRIGLAAGLDKQAQLLPFMQAIGFGFVEIGTVLPHAQVGNPRPRLFRLEKGEALCNRMGFNSYGAQAVRERLAKVRPSVRIPIGISLGKQKETELDDAAQDYAAVLDELALFASYYVVNVSSPNTPGLRKLQGRDYLERLVSDVVRTASHSPHLGKPRPGFVKLAPDLSDAEMEISVEAAIAGGISGFVFGNTSVQPPPNVNRADLEKNKIYGGFSGPHQFERTRQMVMFARNRTKLPIIACGGITTVERARILRGEGADLIQIYTGLIYQGPKLLQALRSVH